MAERVTLYFLVLLVCVSRLPGAFSFSATPARFVNATPSTTAETTGSVLILDHLNINHEAGRHDWLKAFYFDFLQCSVDPRKEENLLQGSKTLWANIGANQFHLPEGKPDAQVLDGIITLAYPANLEGLRSRVAAAKDVLEGSKFTCTEEETVMLVTDPWGSQFKLVAGSDSERDARGSQPGTVSEGLALRELTLWVPKETNFAGIARFYEQILGAPALECNDEKCSISVGPQQSLVFQTTPYPDKIPSHVDLREEGIEAPEGMPTFPSNYGPHISMYIADFATAYDKADALGLCYVNPRFKRRAYTKEAAIDDCMFRCLDIVDPENPDAGVILQLEHEIRSVVKPDGSKYKSCPFDAIPEICTK